jgi:beta-lactam-binding protein with PASTA domain
MLPRLLRISGYLVYALVVLIVFTLAAYSSFSLFVRSGVTTVPDVEGLTRAEAAGVLADQGLELKREADSDRYDDKVPAGEIVQQKPDARTLVKRGSAVQIVLSLGPQRVEVPDLTGKTLSGAQVALSSAGLNIGQLLGVFTAPGPTPLTVLEQDPDPGSSVAPASGADLLVSMAVQEERWVMPDLVYRDYEDVRRAFEARGFRLGSIKFERYEGVAEGIILRQYPLPGHPVTKRDSISLTVATAELLEGLP